jgi:DNA-binding transcriptional ArsR family regulator
VSRHLKLLREAGLVDDRPEGVRRMYRLDDAGIVQARAFMAEVWGEAAARFRLAADNVREQG